MSSENLGFYSSSHTEKLVKIRESYLQRILDSELKGEKSEDNLEFPSSDMYESWVNYAQCYFTDLFDIYSELRNRKYSPEALSQYMGSKGRVARLCTNLLIPGAFLDQSVPLTKKINFLNEFAASAIDVFSKSGYQEPDINFLYENGATKHSRKIAISNLIMILEEACELIYYGDQNIGYPEIGLTRNFIPEHHTLLQDIDINLGAMKFPEIGRIKTCTVYPENPDNSVALSIVADKTVGCVFMHGYRNDKKWTLGRPAVSVLERGYISVNGKNLNTDEIDALTGKVIEAIKHVRDERSGYDSLERKLEYCYIQSGLIRDLKLLLGEVWQLSQGATFSVSDRTCSRQLKKDWGLRYNVEVATELIKRSVTWVEGLTNRSEI